ncbi:hypothetical protein [Planotetraspora phitsanulokensis]|uniref:Uncharacterized protein n=1 Tax=Planotetraspora phitsanulokensis TaxID=575192 RepID=A0A8J3UDQ1_9ACTN|nr:hypothetical protein [Planotetraspora phitsanulokensis]GII42895.1 hypothetical protein Pph01_78980 [Planotetraspora phitsanulokensis]
MTTFENARVENLAGRAVLRGLACAGWFAGTQLLALACDVVSEEAQLVLPVVSLAVVSVVVPLLRRGASPVGGSATVATLWMLVAATWGLVGGTVLLVSAAAVVAGRRASGRLRACDAPLSGRNR